jgi:hypothetical protein
MHLSGEPYSGDRRDLGRATGRERVHRFQGRFPPVLWVLFAPARPRAPNRERDRSAADDLLLIIDENRLHGRGTEIDPEKHQAEARRAASSSVRSMPKS